MVGLRSQKWPLIGWTSSKKAGHLLPPLPGFSTTTSDDIRSLARVLEDVDKLVLETLDANKKTPEEAISEFTSRVHEHTDGELWSYLKDNSGQKYWKMAFDILLHLLESTGGSTSSAQAQGMVKAFEFALGLAHMLEEVQQKCSLLPVVVYRLSMKADIIYSFLDTAETTLQGQYSTKLWRQEDTTSNRNVKFIRFPVKDATPAEIPGNILITKPSTITGLVCIVSLVCTILQLLSFTNTIKSSPLGPGSPQHPDFLSIVQQFLMQTLGLFTLLAPALSSPREQSTWTWTLSTSSILLGISTVPAYLFYGPALSALLACFGSVMQTFVILQLVLKGSGQVSKEEKVHVD
ncbi:hypothetical protein BKA61DRAFT_677305 [Leptodontidium sp. MPI-SDFR-AT-0119]|nr:hypothetical protein BKA61DRAFT_677305 [Leptodontidium sp. MPI-SDFR-AT-0119]